MYRTKFIDFDARKAPKTSYFCCKCQKDIDPTSTHYQVHVVDGMQALHIEDEAAYYAFYSDSKNVIDDWGIHWLGSECAKKVGKKFCKLKQ